MKTIIVPTDFSDGAFNALLHALNIAKSAQAEVMVVHAFLMPPTGTAVMVDITDILQQNAEEGLELLRRRVEKLDIAKGITISYKAKHGTVIDVLQRTASKHNADLVVMGTQGASGITEKFLGSNAAAAARNLKTPVLAVPAEKNFSPIKKIVIATDLKQVKSPKLFEIVEQISDANEASIRFLHVRQISEKHDTTQSDAFKHQVTGAFKRHTPLFTFVFEDDIEEGLSTVIEKEGAEMIVVVRRERGFFSGLFHSSVSQRLVNEAALPVLVLHD